MYRGFYLFKLILSNTETFGAVQNKILGRQFKVCLMAEQQLRANDRWKLNHRRLNNDHYFATEWIFLIVVERKD